MRRIQKYLFMAQSKPIGLNILKVALGGGGPLGAIGKGDTVVIFWLFEETGFLSATGRITADGTIPATP